ncbi:MAG: CBS domain-containing protein [Candidatus Thorarchaeota archaeon]|nr:MAG: CBS domain-containing protein [Candidatus Thorarchaeota archaeon]
MRVKEFMTSVIVTADAATPVVEAAKIMAVEDVGSVIVTKNDVLVGLVTQKDIIAAQLMSEGVYHRLTLEDIMSSPVVTISPDADLGQAIALMHQTGKRHIPVIEGDDIIGIVTSTDVLRVVATLKLFAKGVPTA